MSLEKRIVTKEELEQLIDRAIKKVHGKKENDLCKYLPGPKGGYIHHFTMKKLKKAEPNYLFNLLRDHVVEKEIPRPLEPKQRAPRGSRKKKDVMNISRLDIDKVLELARKVGDKELIARFSPKRPLTALKKELIRSIRNNQANDELWRSYSEAITSLNYASIIK